MSSKTTNKKSEELEKVNNYVFRFGKYKEKSLKDVLSITTKKKNKLGEEYEELTYIFISYISRS